MLITYANCATKITFCPMQIFKPISLTIPTWPIFSLQPWLHTFLISDDENHITAHINQGFSLNRIMKHLSLFLHQIYVTYLFALSFLKLSGKEVNFFVTYLYQNLSPKSWFISDNTLGIKTLANLVFGGNWGFICTKDVLICVRLVYFTIKYWKFSIWNISYKRQISFLKFQSGHIAENCIILQYPHTTKCTILLWVKSFHLVSRY